MPMSDKQRTKEFNTMMNQRSITLVLHELDQVFGKGNALSIHFKQHEDLQASMLLRGLLRQQWFNKVRLERIEAKLGITFDPKDLT